MESVSEVMKALGKPLPLMAAGYLLAVGKPLDWLLFLSFTTSDNRVRISTLLSPYYPAITYLSVVFGATIVSFITLQLVLFFLKLLLAASPSTQLPAFARPSVFPAKTTHRRIFPQEHAFTYSYLVVGVPVGWRGRIGGLVAVDQASRRRGGVWCWWQRVALFEVRGEDHMARGGCEGGLKAKLEGFLKEEGIDHSLYPYAYLVTAPRFLGYSFNPISFWYLYLPDKTLGAIICEVNNTFGERRPYFLAKGEESAAAPSSGSENSEDSSGKGCPKPTTATRIRRTWTKDFHVSPFNSRKGSYSILVSDVLETGKVDVTITLSSSKTHPKVVARLHSTSPKPEDLASMGALHKLKLLFGWWWVGFVTVPRIAKEAAVLFYGRGLHVWYRPEPLGTSMGRALDGNEVKLERLWREYLRHLAKNAEGKVRIRYVDVDSKSEIMESLQLLQQRNTGRDGGDGSRAKKSQDPELRRDDADVHELEFKVLTPAFYTRFIQYAHDFEAIFSELRESSTISITTANADLIPKLFVRAQAPRQLHLTNPVDFIAFKLIQKLRRRPERIERPLTSAACGIGSTSNQNGNGKPNFRTTGDIRGFRLSSMDGYMLGEARERQKSEYRGTVLSILLARRIALGSEGLLWVEGVVFRGALAWVVTKALGETVRVMIEILAA